MIALVTTVFIASVLGSLHCVGMCGAFLALAFGDAEAGASRWKLPLAYHGGRLITYTLLGIAAGAAGSLLNLAGALVGISRVAVPLAGLTVVAFALVVLLRQHGLKLGRLHPPAWLLRFVQRGQRLAMSLTPGRRALAIGLLTTLLPCGWLYAFALVAAGTANPLYGGLVMMVFWSGTLPVLVAAGAGVQQLTGRFGRHLPTVTCLLLLVMGLWTIFGRSHLSAQTLIERATATATQPSVENGADPHWSPLPACCVEEAPPPAPSSALSDQ